MNCQYKRCPPGGQNLFENTHGVTGFQHLQKLLLRVVMALGNSLVECRYNYENYGKIKRRLVTNYVL